MIEKVIGQGYALYVFRTERGCLSYIVECMRTHESVVIDPSEEAGDEYKRAIESHSLALRYIIDTHTHADHVSAYRGLQKKTGAKYVMYESAPSSHVDVRVRDGDVLTIGKIAINILHTPGHASDTVALVLPDAVFTADTLLIEGTGRTD